MDTTDIYLAIRAEIVANHELMHWFTIAVAIVLLVGTVVVERIGKTALSVFLPLLSLAWAASMWRFDFFIHRQAAYLRELENSVAHLTPLPLWETWKSSRRANIFALPVVDILATAVIVVPTLYLLFGPAQQYFEAKSSKWGRAYAFSVSACLILVLLSLTIVPKLASY